jgi:1-acyl-sn-glycerol-3-phosphate acyltransferase
MIASLLTVVFYVLYTPLAALIGFPVALITGNIDFLYQLGVRGAWIGMKLAGISVDVIGREQLDPTRTYIFMCNHVSNLDPPIVLPHLPGRTSVLVKKEVFRLPILGRALRMASMVPVDRSNREAAVASIQMAADVMKHGIHMTIFPEGTRSPDGSLLPLKKGPFYLAMETGFPIVPMTILNTEKMMPKGSWKIRSAAGTGKKVQLYFHPPVETKGFTDRDELMRVVAERIAAPKTESGS